MERKLGLGPDHHRNSSRTFLSCLTFSYFLLYASLACTEAKLSKSARDKLQLKLKTAAKLNEDTNIEYDGLPGEVEYEVDLSDQPETDKGTEEIRFWVFDLIMGEDMADRLDDLICVWDKVVNTDLDTVVILLIGWLVFGGVIFLVSHFIYSTIGNNNPSVSTPAPIPPYQTKISNTPPYQPEINISQAPPLLSDIKISPPAQSDLLPPLPHISGTDYTTVGYITRCWEFIHTDQEFQTVIKTKLLENLNQLSQRSAMDDGLLVEFIEIVDPTTAPTISNITTDNLGHDSLVINSDLSLTIEFRIRTNNNQEHHLHVDRLRGRISITLMKSENILILKLEGSPDIKMRLSQTNIEMSDLLEEVLGQVIRGIQLEINVRNIKEFPIMSNNVFQDNQVAQKKIKLSSSIVSSGGVKPNVSPVSGIGSGSPMKSRKLDVKIVKAIQLGGSAGNCIEPYVVLEVDDPSQRKQTTAGSGSQFVWGETLQIDITNQSSELLFEVWDQGQKVGKSDLFMGLCIVSVSELMLTSSQRHVIPLQGRPYEEDKVSGMITIEFLFKDGGHTLDEADSMMGVVRTFETSQCQAPSGQILTNKKTTYKRQDTNIPDLLNGAEVADMAIKDIQEHQRQTDADKTPNKSTLLIHQVQRPPRSPSKGSRSIGGGPGFEDSIGTTTTTTTTSTESHTDDLTDSIGEPSITSMDSDFQPSYRRGRTRRRNLISSIKKRFTGTRSLSSNIYIDNGGQNIGNKRTDNLLNTVDHVRSVSEHRPEHLESSGRDSFLSSSGHDNASSMSDISGVSNFSTASQRTFVTEESSLVLETLEDGRHHHYLIPIQAARMGKFKKKGTKLHIFMDHIFVARHIKLGTLCQVCNTIIPLRLGKQAYICRDCGLVCHKPCHVRVGTHCQHTSLPSMELEFYSEDSRKI